LIQQGAVVAIGVSGGKDSQAAALATIAYLDSVGHGGPRLLIHADLGSVEWKDSFPVCERLAGHLDIGLVTVRRKAGGLMERWESRWQSSKDRWEALSTVTLVPCWSTPSMRFCTSELKTHPITAELKRRFKGQPIINVTGVRRAESAARSKSTVSAWDADRRILTWRPIVDWSVDEVFAAIDASGLDPHPAYRVFGMSRVSCRWCIMSNIDDMVAAAAQPEGHDLYRRQVTLEADSTFAFQGSRWLGDVAPHLLGGELADRLALAKVNAARRVAAEKRLTKDMLYVKGWPTRMLTDGEADLLAEVRAEVSSIIGLAPTFVDRQPIHQRYADLIAAKPGQPLLMASAA
jgi:3'-phosphoadenosine 5'-phosphosulfate sulfotransferase (PAPS reductase)/FAD synthetase